ncbi:hypothetical protein GZH46_01703 [Fragariocoptes setiger]|uniref:Uncharacterized protein n=1 Tax=Fragariocoptes setiger TaxID=1670756 RepID=A0ABQ7S8R4_9ACAR|nr:hypothetical protein GZH46_01703 [Fragariocoptes setiger]
MLQSSVKCVAGSKKFVRTSINNNNHEKSNSMTSCNHYNQNVNGINQQRLLFLLLVLPSLLFVFAIVSFHTRTVLCNVTTHRLSYQTLGLTSVPLGWGGQCEVNSIATASSSPSSSSSSSSAAAACTKFSDLSVPDNPLFANQSDERSVEYQLNLANNQISTLLDDSFLALAQPIVSL